MRIVVLASGFAPKLYPLTLTQPKALLLLAGRPMLNHVMDQLSVADEPLQVHLVVNARFVAHFRKWLGTYVPPHRGMDLRLVDDGSTDESNKLGAVGDLEFVIRQEKLDDDLIVVAADNIFSESLGGFVQFCRGRTNPVLGIYDVGSLDQARKYGVVESDRDGRLLNFVEKPENPQGRHVGVGLYYYPKATLPLIKQYLDERQNPDHPGRLVQWMHSQVRFHVWSVPGTWYDIGSKETLEEANRIFGRR